MKLEFDKLLRGGDADFNYEYILKGWHRLSINLKRINTIPKALQLIKMEAEGLNREHIHVRLLQKLGALVAADAKAQAIEHYELEVVNGVTEIKKD